MHTYTKRCSAIYSCVPLERDVRVRYFSFLFNSLLEQFKFLQGLVSFYKKTNYTLISKRHYA